MAKDELEVTLTRVIHTDLSRRRFLQGTGLALGTIGLAACGGGTTTTNAGPVAVGSVLDGTGGLNIYGTVMIDATNFAIDEINKKGGVLGRQLKLTAFDAQSTNDKYVQYADQLMLETKAAVIMGGITSGSREAMRPSIDKNKQLYFYNEQYEGGVCDKYVFCTGVTPAQQLGTLIPWAVKEYGKKVYTLAADYNYGHISADWVKVFLGKAGGTLVNQEFIPLDVVNFDSVIKRVEGAKPDVVMSLLVGGNHIAFYRQFAATGLKGKIPIVSATFGLGNEQVVLAPEEVEGLVVIYPYFQELENAVNREWVRRWHQRFGANYAYITDSACTVWNGWHLWAMAVNKAGSLERDAVIKALESGLTFKSPEGDITLNPESHHVVHTVNLAKVNKQRGFSIIKTFPNVAPTDTMEVCDLIKNPNQAKQYTPKF